MSPYDSPAELGEAAILLTLYKQGDFDLFSQRVRPPEAKLADYCEAVPGEFVFAMSGREIPEFLPYHPRDCYRWADSPLEEREIPFLVFRIDEYNAEIARCHDCITVAAAAKPYSPDAADHNYRHYAPGTAQDRTELIGGPGYTEGVPVYASNNHSRQTVFPAE